MMTAARPSARDFYQRFLMARQHINPKDYGVDSEKDQFTDTMVEDFGEYTRGNLTIDELLLRPRTALHFCDTVRQKHGWYDLPDDIILRVILTRRKNPTG